MNDNDKNWNAVLRLHVYIHVYMYSKKPRVKSQKGKNFDEKMSANTEGIWEIRFTVKQFSGATNIRLCIECLVYTGTENAC